MALIALSGRLALPAPAAEAICGYAASIRQFAAADIRQGVTVEMLAGDPTVGVTTPLRFRVVRKPQDEPIDDLQVEHEKLMHLIGVRDDLRDFLHLHPQRVGPGLWQINYTFTNAGNYQFWSDVKYRGTVYSIAQPLLKVSGPVREPTANERVPHLVDSRAGYVASLEFSGPLRAGDTNLMLIKVCTAAGVPVGTEFFLGTPMHIVVVKDDLTVYTHGHAENHQQGGREIYFHQVFPAPGNYKLFAQFRPMKARLPPDEAVLAEFWVKVQKAE